MPKLGAPRALPKEGAPRSNRILLECPPAGGPGHASATGAAGDRGDDPAAVGPLANVASSVSPPGPAALRRRARYALRDTLWAVSALDRLRLCGRAQRDRAAGVAVVRAAPRAEGGHRPARFGNVQTCGSVWACPTCAATIRQRRADEIEAGLGRHLAGGGGAAFLLLTLPHDAGERLADLLATCSLGFRRVLGGSGWQRDAAGFGIVGLIRATEVTVGRSGWHPHLHVLLLTSRPLSADELAALQSRLHGRWARAVESRGHRRPSPKLCGISAVTSAGAVAEYVGKAVLADEAGQRRLLALEMARHDLKAGRESESRGEGEQRNRTPWEVLADVGATGRAGDVAAWREYEAGTRGRRAIEWSRGLKAALLVEERTDDELASAPAAEPEPPEVLAVIAPADWRALTRVWGALAAVLEAAERDGADGVDRALSRLLRAASGRDRPPLPSGRAPAVGRATG